MPKQEGQKSKLLALLHIFEQQTDEEHLLNVPQLVELLARQGILCERKSVYSDIDALNALGYDIRLRRGRSGGYWMATRPFELAELKLLVDAVQSSRVISKASSDKLIHKLEGLASQYEAVSSSVRSMSMAAPRAPTKTCPTAWTPSLRPSTPAGWCASATKRRDAPRLTPSALADGVGERLLLPHRLSGREGAGGHPPLPGG